MSAGSIKEEPATKRLILLTEQLIITLQSRKGTRQKGRDC